MLTPKLRSRPAPETPDLGEARARFEQAAGVATGAERGINNHRTRPRAQGSNHFIEQDRDVWRGAHFALFPGLSSAMAFSKPMRM